MRSTLAIGLFSQQIFVLRLSDSQTSTERSGQGRVLMVKTLTPNKILLLGAAIIVPRLLIKGLQTLWVFLCCNVLTRCPPTTSYRTTATMGWYKYYGPGLHL